MVLGEWVAEDAGFFFEPGAHQAVGIAEDQLHAQKRKHRIGLHNEDLRPKHQMRGMQQGRTESSSEVGKVNISESTHHLVKNQFVCSYRGEVETKGKMGMYCVDR
jgi:hypothetical protein